MRWLVLGMLCLPGTAAAQGWRAQVEVGVRSASWRGVALDSVARNALASDSVPVTVDGFAAFCRPGTDLCTFYRPGPLVRAAPFDARVAATVWGLGVRGLSLNLRGRVSADLARPDAWPMAGSHVQLLEGYAELARAGATFRLGRTTVVSRLGWQGIDGGHVTVRFAEHRVTAGAWGGWGLAQASALPLTSPALNPLDEFQPRDRQLVAGAEIGTRLPWARGRLVYQREVDPAVDYFLSERVAVDLDLSPLAPVGLALGAEYDLAAGAWGTSDVALALRRGRGAATVGARRYRPHFPLWTIWGAFSPSPYRAVFASAEVPLPARIQLWARGERYWFDASDAATPLVTVEDDGWRWSAGAGWDARRLLRLDGTLHAAFGPGAAAAGFDLRATIRPRPGARVGLAAGRLLRPLELRYSDAEVWHVAASVQWRVRPDLDLNAGLVWLDESRERPDAAAFGWDQVRIHAGARLGLGRGADLAGVPAAVRAMPEGR